MKNGNKRTNVCRSTMPDIDVAIAYTMGRACSEGKAMQRPAVRAITCCIILHYFTLYITFLTKSHYFMSVLLSSCQSVYLLLLCLRTVSALRCLFSISAFLRNGWSFRVFSLRCFACAFVPARTGAEQGFKKSLLGWVCSRSLTSQINLPRVLPRSATLDSQYVFLKSELIWFSSSAAMPPWISSLPENFPQPHHRLGLHS